MYALRAALIIVVAALSSPSFAQDTTTWQGLVTQSQQNAQEAAQMAARAKEAAEKAVALDAKARLAGAKTAR